MDDDLYGRLLARITLLETVVGSLIEHASIEARTDIKDELLKIAARDNVRDSEYGGSMTSAAERMLDVAHLRA